MFCTTCGTKNAAESRFCKQCGHELEKTTAGRVREEDFDRALPEDEQINALLERAYRARKAGDNAQAIVLCQEALQLRPDSTTPHSLLGQIYESMGERDLALRAYERVVQLNPGSIADRVKLDELRDGHLPALHGASPPHIVFTQSRDRQGGSQLLSGVALAAVLMLVGAGIALAWRGRSAPASVNTTGAYKSAQHGGDMMAGAQNAGSGGVPSTANVGAAVGDKPTYAAPTAPTAPPAYNPYAWSMPPTIIYTTPERVRTIQAPAAVSSDRSSNLAAVRLPGPKTGAPNKRVMLPADDQTDDKGIMVIQVGPKDTQKDGQKAGASAPVDHGKISVTSTPGGAVANNSQPAGFDARSYIAAGIENEVNSEYDKAISAYSRALGTAGDERGSVYQHIAHCYQLKGDKTSAVTNYHSAITEYHKLIDAGKQVEPAQEGINTCEKAIKTCNY